MTDEHQGRIHGKNRGQVVPKGTRFGRRVLLEDAHRSKQKVLCRCECGREDRVFLHTLIYKKSPVCVKCADKTRKGYHGDSKPHAKNYRIYIIHKDALSRCNNPKAYGYSRYGGRGIRVCDEWASSYEKFRDWALANGYDENLTLDRYPDIDGNYEPGNCRWVTYTEQCRNKRNNRIISAFGEMKTMAEWLEDERCVTSRECLAYRLRAGMPSEDAMTKPPRKITRKAKGHDVAEDPSLS